MTFKTLPGKHLLRFSLLQLVRPSLSVSAFAEPPGRDLP